jgi:hypothetical protein
MGKQQLSNSVCGDGAGIVARDWRGFALFGSVITILHARRLLPASLSFQLDPRPRTCMRFGIAPMSRSCGPVGIGQVVTTGVVLCLPIPSTLPVCGKPLWTRSSVSSTAER